MLNLTVALITSALLAQTGPSSLQSSLAGAWTGTLEYRDYRSDGRVTLPTTLVVTAGSDTTLEFAYVYDDGPGKTVRSRERITIDADQSTYRIQNADGTYDATFTAEGLRQFGAESSTIVLIGKGTENDVPVDLRITIKADGRIFTMLRESRRAGAEWLFRNQYKFAKTASR